MVLSGCCSDIKRIQQQIPTFIEKGEVEIQFKAFHAEWSAANDATRHWAAPNDTLTKVQQAHTETVRRLNAVELLTACKMDRTEVAYLEGLANNFENFGMFQTAVTTSIGGLEQIANAHTNQIAESKACTDALKVANEAVLKKLTTLTPKTETRALAIELERHCETMKRFCDTDRVDNVCPIQRLLFTFTLLFTHHTILCTDA